MNEKTIIKVKQMLSEKLNAYIKKNVASYRRRIPRGHFESGRYDQFCRIDTAFHDSPSGILLFLEKEKSQIAKQKELEMKTYGWITGSSEGAFLEFQELYGKINDLISDSGAA